MKKLLFILIAVLAISCEKENFNIEQNAFQLDEKLLVAVDNNMLVFDSEDHFNQVIEILQNYNNEKLDLWESKIGFKSLRTLHANLYVLKESDIEDDIFRSLINENYRIQIGHYVFEVDIKHEKVHILDKTNNGKFFKSGLSFSFSDDVFAILNNEECVKGSRCNVQNQKITASLSWDYMYMEVSMQIHYYSLGIYRSLYAEIEKPSTSTNPWMRMSLTQDAFLDNGNYTVTYNAPSTHYTEKSRSNYWSMYKKTRALRDYSVKMKFNYDSDDTSETHYLVNICEK